MRNFQEWFSANELKGMQGMPNTPQGVNKKARTQNWKKRDRDGVQGSAVEYHYSSLPIETQQALGFNLMANVVKQVAQIQVQSSIEERLKQLEAMISQLTGVIALGEAKQQSDGEMNWREKQLLRDFRLCTEDGKLMLLASANAMAEQAKKACEASKPLEAAAVA